MTVNNRHLVTYVLMVVAVAGLLVAPLTAISGTAAAQSTNGTTTTDTASESSPVRFNQPPSVDMQTRELTITKETPGTVSLFIRNPLVNEHTMIVDGQMDVGPGVYMVGSRLASGSGAGTVAASYEIPPGTSRTVELDIYPTEVRDMTVDGTVTYWPKGNRDGYNLLNPSFQFNVEEVPSAPEPNNIGENETIVGTQGTTTTDTPDDDDDGGGGGWPPRSLLLYGGVGGLLLLVGVAIVRALGPTIIDIEE